MLNSATIRTLLWLMLGSLFYDRVMESQVTATVPKDGAARTCSPPTTPSVARSAIAMCARLPPTSAG